MKTKNFLFDRDTLLHLRLPFSFFLLPIFCFAISQSEVISWMNAFIVFASLHFFIYPGSNVYNSYMDKDKGSIGGLRNPPPATKKLYYSSMILDIIGILLCLFISWQMAVLMTAYVAVSKAYSWDGIRLKKYGLTGWFIVMLFQGGYTYLMVNMAVTENFSLTWFTVKNQECMVLASLLIGGFYPLTQIYQHQEDSERGDLTISYRLGVRGTFVFSGILFLLASAIAFHYFREYYGTGHFVVFTVCLLPVIFYYLMWFMMTEKNPDKANFDHAMRITFISSACMIICFCILFWMNYQTVIYS